MLKNTLTKRARPQAASRKGALRKTAHIRNRRNIRKLRKGSMKQAVTPKRRKPFTFTRPVRVISMNHDDDNIPDFENDQSEDCSLQDAAPPITGNPSSSAEARRAIELMMEEKALRSMLEDDW